MYRDAFKQDDKSFCRTGDHVKHGKYNVISIRECKENSRQIIEKIDILINGKIIGYGDIEDSNAYMLTREIFDQLYDVLTKYPCVFFDGFILYAWTNQYVVGKHNDIQNLIEGAPQKDKIIFNYLDAHIVLECEVETDV